MASLPCEILPSREFYDYDDKYLLDQAGTRCRRTCSPEQTAEVRRLAVECYRAVECEGMARVDFLLERATGKLYINEINTIPGFTSISMYPKMWEQSGLPFSALIDRLIELALERHRRATRPRGSRDRIGISSAVMATIPKTVSYQEWLTMPVVQDAIEEAVNGEIRIMPPNKLIHARVVHRLALAFARALDDRSVEILESGFGLVIVKDPLTCRIPDLALFHRSNIVEEDGYVHSAPDLAIEVLSDSDTRRARQEKLRDYESLGVPEVWLVSPQAQTIEVMLLDAGKLRTGTIIVEGQIRPTHFPEAVIEVTSIWPE